MVVTLTPIGKVKAESTSFSNRARDQALLQLLDRGAMDVDELAIACNVPERNMDSILSSLIHDGLVREAQAAMA